MLQVVAALAVAAVALGAVAWGVQHFTTQHSTTQQNPDSAPITTPGKNGELNADLLDRFNRAAAAASQEGVPLAINSGARSKTEQQQLIDESVAQNGTTVAHTLVAPVNKSAHVKGLAIDVTPPSGAAWLEQNGSRFGLCRVFANEAWHFEPSIPVGGTCPALVPDGSVLWN